MWEIIVEKRKPGSGFAYVWARLRVDEEYSSTKTLNITKARKNTLTISTMEARARNDDPDKVSQGIV